MHIAYFDEVKFLEGKQPYFWLGCIVATPESVYRIETAMSELSNAVFKTPELNRDTEFHAADIFHRKRNFRDWPDINARLDVMKPLLRLAGSDEIDRIFVRIEPGRMYGANYEQVAFMYLAERVEALLRLHKSPGILIGDREDDAVSGAFAEALSGYRTSGTRYEFGTTLTHLIDTVHFTSSHHSRMLQLADLYVWALQLSSGPDQDRYPRSELVNFIRSETKLLYARKYKIWPTDQSWR